MGGPPGAVRAPPRRGLRRLHVTADQVRAFRARQGGLAAAWPAGRFDRAAWGGLQDTAPRSALLSLSARVGGVGPASWADPRLVQVWGPRLAVHLVPAADLAVFTLGRLPRDERACRRLERTADAVLEAVGDSDGRSTAEVFASVRDRPGHRVRAASATGRFVLRWDARRTLVRAADPGPDRDPEPARHELARRYLGWLGPGTRDGFARWAGVEPADAAITWAAIEPETTEVVLSGRARRLRSVDVDAFRCPDPVRGTRLLPPNDPYLRPDRQFLVDSGAHHDALYRATGGAAGAILTDGRIVGTWTRRQHRVALHPWRPLDAAERDALVAAARGLSDPLGRAVDLAPLDPS